MKRKDENVYSLSWETLKPDWPLWVILSGLFIIGAILYPILPKEVPIHWNLQGEVNDYVSRFSAAFISPLFILGVYILLLVLPLVDPFRKNYVRFASIYRLMRWVIMMLIITIHTISLALALGYNVQAHLIINGAIAISFIVVGHAMEFISPNFIFGIRTPWTLANEEVWRQTHELGAKVWVIGGFICLALVPVPSPWGAHAFIACFAVMVLVPVIFSYVIFRRLTHKKK